MDEKRNPILIQLIGASDTGKSTTLKCLMSKLIDDNRTEILQCRYKSENISQYIRSNGCKWFTKQNRVSDLSVVVKYKDLNIGITTFGDSEYLILKTYNSQRMKSVDIDVFIYANHPNLHPENSILNKGLFSVIKNGPTNDDSERCVKEIMGIINNIADSKH